MRHSAPTAAVPAAEEGSLAAPEGIANVNAADETWDIGWERTVSPLGSVFA
jgi:hypothetical protein